MFPIVAALAVVLADPAQFEAVLQKYVLEDGKVSYGALKADLAPLTAYVEGIGATNPDSLASPQAKLAFWLNTYNALVLHSMAAEYPESKGRLGGFLGRASYFYRRKFRAGGQMRSLADIENNTIRSISPSSAPRSAARGWPAAPSPPKTWNPCSKTGPSSTSANPAASASKNPPPSASPPSSTGSAATSRPASSNATAPKPPGANGSTSIGIGA